MTPLGFDLRALQAGFKAHKPRGIGMYALDLARRVALAPAELGIRPLYDPAFESVDARRCGAVEFEGGPLTALRPWVREYLWQRFFSARYLAATARREKLSALFFPTHLDVPPRLAVPYAATAHDMIQAAMAEQFYSSFKNRLGLRAQVAALKGARLILADSRHTKGDVIRYAGVPAERVRVVYLGADPVFRPGAEADVSRLRLPERFILNVGGVDWRKNTRLLLEAFGALAQRRPGYHLVMAGEIQNDPRFPDLVRGIAARGLQDRVITTGFVSREELAALYGRATALLYPSLYEGFGLPPLEAMACGCPVITTNRTSIPEVCGDAAILLDPGQPEAFGHALILLAEDEGERRRLSRAGVERAKRFSWDACAAETWAALAECFGAAG